MSTPTRSRLLSIRIPQISNQLQSSPRLILSSPNKQKAQDPIDRTNALHPLTPVVFPLSSINFSPKTPIKEPIFQALNVEKSSRIIKKTAPMPELPRRKSASVKYAERKVDDRWEKEIGELAKMKEELFPDEGYILRVCRAELDSGWRGWVKSRSVLRDRRKLRGIRFRNDLGKFII